MAEDDEHVVHVKDVYRGGAITVCRAARGLTVKALKDQIAELVQDLDAEDQKLIFCGKVLKDADRLDAVLDASTSPMKALAAGPDPSDPATPNPQLVPAVLLVRRTGPVRLTRAHSDPTPRATPL
eukprot:CAMPEP_0118861208 /NCGR_PEP_ID=MMETSP1163-20130328/6816_1 /TAXON_ID=124430 /ORGANISM="Phaeomonas parva, Strain CCMP2877" /LENGTH=124 /DNA_ID=CAMNT_0006794999 /DNA_START=92 /DNA_END=462 /DNA_ORIENTATION=-